ncbi:MAG: ABC transporter permease [Hespellia sp.]|nr:ABC transporter permease [Hespellia sp.]
MGEMIVMEQQKYRQRFGEIVAVEKRKYRHSLWKLCFFLIPLLPCIIGTVNYQQNIEILKDGWYDLWTQFTLFYAFFFFAPMIAIAASFLWRVEHRGRNWNLYMTMPVETGKLYLAKFAILVRLIVELQLLVGVLFLLAGMLIGVPGKIPLTILWWLIRGTLGALVIAAIQMLVSMVIHNFAVPVLVGFLGGIAGYLVASYGYGIYFPYSQLMMGMNANKAEDVLTQGNVVFFSVVVIYFVVFCIMAVWWLKKRDVR